MRVWTKHARRVGLGASILAMLTTGCIESQRAQAPPLDTVDTSAATDGATDTAGPDTGVTPDDTLGEDTTRPVDARDASEPECVGNGDCAGVDVGPCELAQCKDTRCVVVAARDGDDCDDGDACTKDTVCDGGFCKSGEAVTCPPPAGPCREAVCDASSGCQTVKAAEFTPCDNGAGPEVGACTALGWAEGDACDAGGACLDRYRPVASGSGSAEGSWYFVASTAGAGTTANLETARGWMDLGSGGGVTLAGVTTSTDPSPSVTSPWSSSTAGSPAGGFACGDATGRLSLVLADGVAFRGQHTPNARTLAALEPDARRLLVAVRPTGQVAQVHGAYRFVSTSLDANGAPRTWFGELAFEEGCVAEVGGAFVTAPGGPVAALWSILGASGCLEEDDEGYAPYQLQLEIAQTVASPTWEGIRWAGAIAPGGDVLVLTRDDDEEHPSYGTLVLIRESPVATGVNLGPAHFVTFFHGAHPGSGQPTAELGGLAISAAGLASGWLQAPAPIGVRPLVDPEVRRTVRGRYAHTLNTSERQRSQSGWITAANDFGFVFAATPVSSNYDLLESNTPASPSLGFVVRVLGQTAPTP